MFLFPGRASQDWRAPCFREMLLRVWAHGWQMASMAEQNGIEAVPYDNSDGNYFKSLSGFSARSVRSTLT